MTTTRLRVGFIGAGRVGGALAYSLARAGYPVVALSSRTPAAADALAAGIPGCRSCASAQEAADLADLVFVTTPDDAIVEAVASVSWSPRHAVVHTSGAESGALLASAAAAGAATGSLHPLQTFADHVQARDNLPGSVFAVEADGRLRHVLLDIVAALGGSPIELRPEDKALYHAAAVLVSNYMVTLAKLATDLWLRFGVERPAALRALMPLLRGTVNNLDAVGLPSALTGPVARGDVSTVGRHLAALEDAAPEMLPMYRELARHTIPIALAKGSLSDAGAAALRGALAAAKSPTADAEGRAFSPAVDPPATSPEGRASGPAANTRLLGTQAEARMQS